MTEDLTNTAKTPVLLSDTCALVQNHGTEAETKIKGLRAVPWGQAGGSASFVWPSNSVSVSKEKGGIRVWPIHCIKSMTVITIITPQFALSE